MKTYLKAYDNFLQFERGLSPLTRENYARDLAKLAKLCGELELNQLNGTHIRRFIATLHGQGLSGKSIARMLSSWRSFYEFLIARHAFLQNPIVGLRAPKSPKTLPHALSIEQAAKLVEIKDTDALSLRDKAMFELFYSSGLRLSELVNLNLDAFNLPEGTVTVTGKGNKTRIVPLGSQAILAIQTWLPARALLLKTAENSCFISHLGKRISQRAVQLRLKDWAIKQGLHTHVHPHMLRHSFASHVLQSSGDLRAVQEMLGHANISTTQIYTHLDYQHLSKIYDAAHPRAKKKSA